MLERSNCTSSYNRSNPGCFLRGCRRGIWVPSKAAKCLGETKENFKSCYQFLHFIQIFRQPQIYNPNPFLCLYLYKQPSLILTNKAIIYQNYYMSCDMIPDLSGSINSWQLSLPRSVHQVENYVDHVVGRVSASQQSCIKESLFIHKFKCHSSSPNTPSLRLIHH